MTTLPGSGYRERLRTSVLIGLCCFVVYNANLRADQRRRHLSRRATCRSRSCSTTPSFSIRSRRSPRRGKASWGVLDAASARRPHHLALPGGGAGAHRAALRARGRVPAPARLDGCAAGSRRAESWRSSPPRSWRRSPRRSSILLLRRRTTAPIALLLTMAYALRHHDVGDQQPGAVAARDGGVAGDRRAAAAHRAVHRAAGARGGVAARAHRRQPPAGCHPRGGARSLRTLLGGPAPGGAARRRGGAADAARCCSTTSASAGNVAGGYGAGRQGPASSSTTCLPAIAGLLVSPTRGLLVFSPFLLFLVLAWRSPAARSRRAASHAGDERRRRHPDPALRQNRLAGRPLLGTALHDRPSAAAHLDAGAGGRRAARRRTGVLPARGRRGHRHRSHRRLLRTPAAIDVPIYAADRGPQTRTCGPRGTGGTRPSSRP